MKVFKVLEEQSQRNDSNLICKTKYLVMASSVRSECEANWEECLISPTFALLLCHVNCLREPGEKTQGDSPESGSEDLKDCLFFCCLIAPVVSDPFWRPHG